MIQTLKLYTPWSFSFRRWVRRLYPDIPIDRYTTLLDQFEHQRHLLGFVYAYIDLHLLRDRWHPRRLDLNLLSYTILPLYLRWLREVIAPADAIRSTAIIARRKPMAQEIIRRCFVRPLHLAGHRLSAEERDVLFTPASHSLRSVNSLRGSSFHYCLVLDTDLFHARHIGSSFGALLQCVAPFFSGAPGSALIFVGDSVRHPRSGFARMVRRQPYPLPIPDSTRTPFIHSTGSPPALDNPRIIPWISPDIKVPHSMPPIHINLKPLEALSA
ncbi:MAG: hypothetical protein NC342_08480 [Pseudoflavonifractor sp.]|nr:hypothetical protein [Alloprevotella sp.]MCM1117556.1 hypothetical protein [Pseudoflavonifractor sp.]